MRRGWRAAAGALALLWLTGCSTIPAQPPAGPDGSTPSTPATPTPSEPPVFRLGYDPDDALNPYLATGGVNTQLGELLYDGLYGFAADMTPVARLSGELTRADRAVTIRLRADAAFSDGAAVTPADVAASFDKARTHAVYGPALAAFSGVKAEPDGRLVFTLSGGEPEAEACLSFPVLKAAQLDAPRPLGTGRYALRQTDGGAELIRRGGEGFAVIGLTPASGADTLLYGLESGLVSYFRHELPDGTVPRTGSATAAVDMNALVFLGVNANRTGLSLPAVRQALSAALDREALCRTAFSGCARPALSPWHPAWGRLTDVPPPLAEDAGAARTLLAQAGYAVPGGTTAKGAPPAKKLEVELLVNGENAFRTAAAELVRAQLEAVGVAVTVNTVSFGDYTSLIRRGAFDLYIGEVRLTPGMSLAPWLTADGGGAAGIRQGGDTARAYTAYREGIGEAAEVLAAFGGEVPYLPLCWRQGLALYSRGLADVRTAPLESYCEIEKWMF